MRRVMLVVCPTYRGDPSVSRSTYTLTRRSESFCSSISASMSPSYYYYSPLCPGECRVHPLLVVKRSLVQDNHICIFAALRLVRRYRISIAPQQRAARLAVDRRLAVAPERVQRSPRQQVGDPVRLPVPAVLVALPGH